ncbi:MAG: hypothetical protein ABID61_00825 [Candidatus Micrarchaeota archaeon]
MNSIKSLLIFAIVFIFIVGCVAPPQNGTTPSTPNNLPPTQPQDNQTPPSVPDDTPPLPPQDDQPPSVPDDQPPSVPDDQNDLVGKDYAALVTLGIPLECTIESTYEGQTTVMKVYMKGSQDMRTEINTPESPACTKMLGVSKQGTYYLGCAEGVLFPGCDWLSIDQQESTGETTSGYSAPDYSQVPSSKISCVPWIYDSSKFATPGTICTLDDLMQNFQT